MVEEIPSLHVNQTSTIAPPAERSQFRIVVDPHRNCRRFSPCDVDRHEGTVLLSARVSYSVKRDWQNQVLAATGYRELGMFNDAAQALEDIEPEERTRKEVLGAP